MSRFVVFMIFVVMPVCMQAAYTIKDGKLINMHEVATLSVQEHYSLAKQALERKNWPEVIRQTQVIIKNFPGTAFAWDSYFYLGEAYFHLRELDLANANFSIYLKQVAPKFFEQAIEYKFHIAQRFESGDKLPILGIEGMPRWMPASREAIDIYDEVVMALPQHDLAVQALLGKGNLLFKEKEFKESIETFQTLIRRFPKHPLACDSYIAITKVYLTQSKEEYPDPDMLDLAEINAKKFKIDFPSHPKIAMIDTMLEEMKELFAGELYKTAQFYERTKKPGAAVIYYSKIVNKYPSTQISTKSQKRLDVLRPKKEEPLEEKIEVHKKASDLIVDSSEESQNVQ
ncbi:MAG: outer membrane protein assembly factor BamD [Verrucomicrobia bacterium]|nr:outer membrane protein assembly factor BamD [Verrucomicrobiota bacterium]